MAEYLFKYTLNCINPKGKMRYEYNPFYNFRRGEGSYLKNAEGAYLSIAREVLQDVHTVGSSLQWNGSSYVGEDAPTDEGYMKAIQSSVSLGLDWSHGYGFTKDGEIRPLVYEEGGIIQDLVTGLLGEPDLLNFDLTHPVEILGLYAFDNSVNLILNDRKNPPRLINSRFTTLENNTYVRVDRFGTQDTNLYDAGEFDSDSALLKTSKRIPQLKFEGTVSLGMCLVGMYQFFFKCADADGNESNIIAESGLVPIFIGESGLPEQIRGGQADERSDKSIQFSLYDLDTSYASIKVIFCRASGLSEGEMIPSILEIVATYPISQGMAHILITGLEETIPRDLAWLMRQKVVISAAKTQAICKNRLFLGNLTKITPDYADLFNLSLDILPFYLIQPVSNLIGNMDYLYQPLESNTKRGYYSEQNVYNYVGYWPDEWYRIGVVYVYKDGSLSDVFNIRGIGRLSNILDVKVGEVYSPYYSDYSDETSPFYKASQRNPYTNPRSSNYKVDDNTYIINTKTLENAAGVIRFPEQEFLEVSGTNWTERVIYSLALKIPDSSMQKLRALGVMGFFVVRQKRIPTTLCQAFVQGFHSYLGLPTLSVINLYTDTSTLTGHVSEIVSSFKSKSWAEVNKNNPNVFLYTGGMIETFIENDGDLNEEYDPEFIHIPYWDVEHDTDIYVNPTSLGTLSAYCPEASILLKKYSTLFAGGSFTVRNITVPCATTDADEDSRLYHCAVGKLPTGLILEEKLNIIFVPEGGTSAIKKVIFRAIAGKAEAITYRQPLPKELEKEAVPYRNHFNSAKKKRHRHFGLKIALAAVIVVAAVAATVVSFGSLAPLAAAGVCMGLGAVASAAGAGLAMVQDTYTLLGNGGARDLYIDSELGYLYLGTVRAGNTNVQRSFLVRGIFSPYLGLYGASAIKLGEFINIYNNTVNLAPVELFKLRKNDASPYYAISDRYELQEPWAQESVATDSIISIFRGDSYVGNYTQRINRNFSDPDAPTNDTIVKATTWKDNYDEEKGLESDVNRGDVNAVGLGIWLTIPIRSSINLALRDQDNSYPGEAALYGKPRGFFPKDPIDVSGSSKTSESFAYNPGFSLSTGFYPYFLAKPSYNEVKLQTMIAFSEKSSGDLVNGFRVFGPDAMKSFPVKYGGIMKLVNYMDNLMVVFEHGVGIIPISPNTLVESSGGLLQLASSVIMAEMQMVSNTLGSLWGDSVCATELGVYGVDTVEKKIWFIPFGSPTMRVISDGYVLSFLIDNITLEEDELTPIIGLRNVKTHYNANKLDVMFTYYDNTIGFEETTWNLCWNELQQKWITFYSWVPSFSANIRKTYFSYDRNSSKWIAKLAASSAGELLPEEEQTASRKYDTLANGACVDNLQIDQWPTKTFIE